jgi:hypothetical protein
MSPQFIAPVALLIALLPLRVAIAGTVSGFVRDQNWYARYNNNSPGVGYYEFAVNGNKLNATEPGAVASTDVYGQFSSSVPSAGSYTICSWDVWWRSAYAFNVQVPITGTSPSVDLRLQATMWGYPAFWDNTGYTEFGQTFVATGPISMIYLRLPAFSGSPTYRLTIHEGGPAGPQIGEERDFGTGDQRPIYGYGQMPTVAGQTYYARIRTSPSTTAGVVMQMDPRPDFSDPMPGGCLWLGSPGNVQPYPDRDLGLIIMSDDDGLRTDMYTRSGGATLTGQTVGQTFTARGVNLISAAVWLPDPATPVYTITIYNGGPNGTQVGAAKSGRPARVTADPEMLVTWAPGECPLNPGDTYYLEISSSSGSVNSAMANPNNPYVYGQAYQNQAAVAGTDLACTLMEEAEPGSTSLQPIRFTSEPQVLETQRATTFLTVRWNTDILADSSVEFAADTPPYNQSMSDSRRVTSHAMLLSNLKPHAMYHFRVRSSAPGCRPLTSRDFVICTRPSQTNLLLNPGFEWGTVTSSANRPLTNWIASGNIDLEEANGTWFWGLPPHSGQWLLQGAVNGSSSDGYIRQTVPVTPGKSYTFSAWVTTWPREGSPDTWKYDVWNNNGRLIYMRLGIDPYGGSNPLSPNIQWTPRMYSHLHYSNFAKTATAKSSAITVFVSMKGDGEVWHLYGVDDCVLTETPVVQPYWTAPELKADGSFAAEIAGDPGTTNIIQISSDLIHWSNLMLLRQTNSVVPFIDSTAPPLPSRFYRAILAQ